jgi:hypothetical protein
MGLVGGIGGSYTYYTDESGRVVEVTDEQVLGMKSDNYVETLNNLTSTLDEANSS